jgi:hypothetical protein
MHFIPIILPITFCAATVLRGGEGGCCHAAQVPDLVDLYMRGETRLDDYITHNLPFDKVSLQRIPQESLVAAPSQILSVPSLH